MGKIDMFKNRFRLRNNLLFFALFLIVVSSFSCSPKETSTDSYAKRPTAQIRSVWAKDFGPGQLDAHYLKHKGEFKDITKEEYLNAARLLLNSVPNDDILEKRRDNGDVLHYRVSTGEFSVMAKDGRIRTYFKADYRYWLRQ
jgi:pyocin large subunit-like protein